MFKVNCSHMFPNQDLEAIVSQFTPFDLVKMLLGTEVEFSKIILFWL